MFLKCLWAVAASAALFGILPAKAENQIDRFGAVGVPNEFACGSQSVDEWTRDIAKSDLRLRSNPNDAASLFVRSNAYSCMNDYERAISDLDKAIALRPDIPQMFYDRGINYSMIRDYPHAVADFSQAIALKPVYAQAYNNRGNAYAKLGYLDQAISDLSTAVRLVPTYADAFVNRGLIYARKGDYGKAFSDYGDAIRLNPNDVNAYINRGATYYAAADFKNAIADFDEVLERDPTDSVALLDRCDSRGMGNVDLDKAIDDCNRDLAARPGHINTLLARSLVYIRLGRYDDAIADASACLNQDGKRSDALFLRGIALLRKGDAVSGKADIAAARSIFVNIDQRYLPAGIAP
ncbi:MAG TPA: tetratricopeptide repeat protein [Rhizomicrobium sp.]|jgi:tetratricopeptide (TPR) repeat protein|nr:tetratricopeptide repeat protein [Rhizomicrobium sp.]